VEYLYLILGLGTLALFLAAKRHVRLQFTSLTYDGHSLKYQDGFFAKSTRMLNLTKIQDVRVDQGVMDRMLGIGTVTFETAGDSSRLVMENVDRPQEVAHRILSLAQSTRSI
jgi:membrane protein YdbS with pleckstrin-like domain